MLWKNNIKQQLTGKGTSSAYLSCVCACSKPCMIPRAHSLPSTWAREPLQPPSSANAGIVYSHLDYKDFSPERKFMWKQPGLLETTGEPLLFYLAVSWNLVSQQGREPEWFPPPIVPFCPSFPPECHLVGHREEKQEGGGMFVPKNLASDIFWMFS